MIIIEHQERMKKIILITNILLILIVNISIVSALSFDKDTTFNQENIKYIFSSTAEYSNFEFTSKGIIIDDLKILSEIQGGELTIKFYELGNNTKISFKTNVEQDISFKILKNYNEQYLTDGENFYIRNLYVNTTETNYTLQQVTSNTNKSTVETTIKKRFFNQYFVVFSINDKLVKIRNVDLMYIVISLMILIILTRRLLK